MSAMLKADCFDESRVLPSCQRQKSFHSDLASKTAALCLEQNFVQVLA